MPTYQYACTDCDHAFEQVQSFTEDSLTTCPQCEGRLRKIFNAVGVVFKGSGFYRTDSRADAPGADKGADTGADRGADKGADKGAAKNESKTEGKTGSSPSKSDNAPAASGVAASTTGAA